MKSDNELFPECLICPRKQCRSATVWVLDICEYGISYVNDGEKLQRVTASGTLRHLSQNIRHELNKVLQVLISEACLIDPNVSLEVIDKNSPASRIVAASLIIDNFVSMISGVNDFHLDSLGVAGTGYEVRLSDLLRKYWDIFGLIKGAHRAGALREYINIDKKIVIKFGLPLIEYMIAVLVDNAYKHSIDGSVVSITCDIHDEFFCDLKFSNYSAPLNNPEKLFRKGYQERGESDGFGFGLFWAKVLEEHYNRMLGLPFEEPLSVSHEEVVYSQDSVIMEQIFTVHNIRMAKTNEN